MKQSQFIEKIYSNTNKISKENIKKSIDIMFSLIDEALSQHKRVQLRGFGVFTTRKMPSRKARNPKSGEEIFVDSKHKPFFKTSTQLRKSINEK